MKYPNSPGRWLRASVPEGSHRQPDLPGSPAVNSKPIGAFNMSTQNMITVTFTDSQLQSLDNAIGEVETVFAPFIALSPTQRRRIRRMGERSEQFCRQALHTAELNPQIL